ncbi:hypothetical protein [Orrella sp. 11846]|uniref:hypothetical protein n=1 Tax=Orrella sp. 11846 TaxID=3409913 RepID=UPI003B5C3C01
MALLLMAVVLIVLKRPDNLWLYRDGTVLQGVFSAIVIGLFLFLALVRFGGAKHSESIAT